jgi:hypothetical protein
MSEDFLVADGGMSAAPTETSTNGWYKTAWTAQDGADPARSSRDGLGAPHRH